MSERRLGVFSPGPCVSIGKGPLLTVQQVAAHLTVSRSMVYKEIQRGNLTATRLGSCIRISLRDVEVYLLKRTSNEPVEILDALDNWNS